MNVKKTDLILLHAGYHGQYTSPGETKWSVTKNEQCWITVIV